MDTPRAISGATRLAAVVGTPVRHSLSPAILNAAFAATGADWVYTAFEVADGEGAAAVAAMRTLGIGGLSVTMPHKAAAAAAVDERTDAAEALGAVNCVYWQGTTLCGDNTDGPGFLDALRIDEGIDPAGLRCVVVGAGGAGRAVARALGQAKAADVAVVNRSPERAAHAAALAGPAGRVGPWGDPSVIAAADVVVNATPLGMGVVVGTDGGHEPWPFDVSPLTNAHVVVDLIYHPASTPLLVAARERGAIAVNGLGMLIHQAAHAFRRWTNEEPALEAMSAAALSELAQRSGNGRN
jgi:shikimate dehydrogenase